MLGGKAGVDSEELMDFRFLLIWGWKSGLIGSKSSKVHHDPFQSAHWYAKYSGQAFRNFFFLCGIKRCSDTHSILGRTFLRLYFPCVFLGRSGCEENICQSLTERERRLERLALECLVSV